MKRWDLITLLTASSHILTWMGFLWLVFLPSYGGESVTVTTEGVISEVTRHMETLIDANGFEVIFLLFAPVVLTAAVWLSVVKTSLRSARRKAVLWAGSLVFLGACVVSVASIGLLYIPAALILVLAAGLNQVRSQQRGFRRR